MADELRCGIPIRVGGKYRLRKKIGSGSYGDVYHSTNILSREEVAVKIQPGMLGCSQLAHEFRVYKALAGSNGIPRVRWFGTECDYNAMVIDLLGPSLENLFGICKRKFSLKTVLLLADQLISRIETIHARGFVHRDIKPDHFLLGRDVHRIDINIVDFGLAKEFRDPNTYLHIPSTENNGLVGTPRYCSINAHLGFEHARRDDLESLAYTLIYLIRGSLPWQSVESPTRRYDHRRIMKKKQSTPTGELCQGLPCEFATFLDYTRALKFSEKPDYSFIRELFRSLCAKRHYQYDFVFDWSTTQSDVQEDPSGSSRMSGVVGSDELIEKVEEPVVCERRLRSHTRQVATSAIPGSTSRLRTTRRARTRIRGL